MELKIIDYSPLGEKLEMYATVNETIHSMCGECGNVTEPYDTKCSECGCDYLHKTKIMMLYLKKEIKHQIYTINRELPKDSLKLLEIIDKANKLEEEFWIN